MSQQIKCPECDGEGCHMIQGEFPVPCRTCRGARWITEPGGAAKDRPFTVGSIMATATQRTEKQSHKGNPPAPPKEEPKAQPPVAAPAAVPATTSTGAVIPAPDFSSDAGRGMEGATQESF